MGLQQKASRSRRIENRRFQNRVESEIPRKKQKGHRKKLGHRASRTGSWVRVASILGTIAVIASLGGAYALHGKSKVDRGRALDTARYRIEKDGLENINRDLAIRNEDLATRNVLLSSQIDILNAAVARNEVMYSILDSTFQRIMQDNKELVDENNLLKTELDHSRRKIKNMIETFEKSVSDYTRIIENQQHTIDSIKDEKKTLESHIIELLQKLELAENEKDKALENIDDLESMNRSKQDIIMKAEAELERVKFSTREQIIELEARLEDFSVNAHESTAILIAKENECKVLNQELLAKTSSFQKELETVQREKELIGKANQALHEEVITINQRSERQKDEISMLGGKLKELQNAIESKERDRNRLEEELKENNDKIQGLEKRIDVSTIEQSFFRSQMSKLKLEIDQITKSGQVVIDNAVMLKEEELNRLQRSLEELQRNTVELEKKNRDLQDERSVLGKSLKETGTELGVKIEELETAKNRIEEIKEERDASIIALESRTQEYASQISALKEELSLTRHKLSEAESQNAAEELEELIQEFEMVKMSLEDMAQQAESELSDSQNEIAHLRQQLTLQKDKDNTELDELRTTTTLQKSELDRLIRENDKVRPSVNQLKLLKDSLESNINNITTEFLEKLGQADKLPKTVEFRKLLLALIERLSSIPDPSANLEKHDGLLTLLEKRAIEYSSEMTDLRSELKDSTNREQETKAKLAEQIMQAKWNGLYSRERISSLESEILRRRIHETSLRSNILTLIKGNTELKDCIEDVKAEKKQAEKNNEILRALFSQIQKDASIMASAEDGWETRFDTSVSKGLSHIREKYYDEGSQWLTLDHGFGQYTRAMTSIIELRGLLRDAKISDLQKQLDDRDVHNKKLERLTTESELRENKLREELGVRKQDAEIALKEMNSRVIDANAGILADRRENAYKDGLISRLESTVDILHRELEALRKESVELKMTKLKLHSIDDSWEREAEKRNYTHSKVVPSLSDNISAVVPMVGGALHELLPSGPTFSATLHQDIDRRQVDGLNSRSFFVQERMRHRKGP